MVKENGTGLIAMKFGDHCWIKNLTKDTTLNGKHVVLQAWAGDAQRWRCHPVGWEHTNEFVSVRPRNLTNTPPNPSPNPSPNSNPSLSSAQASVLAARLMTLMQRESDLRERVSDGNVGLGSHLCHKLCQQALLVAQVDVLKLRGDPKLSIAAQEKLDTHISAMAPLQEAWAARGGEKIDFWNYNMEDDVEDDPALKAWISQRKARLLP